MEAPCPLFCGAVRPAVVPCAWSAPHTDPNSFAAVLPATGYDSLLSRYPRSLPVLSFSGFLSRLVALVTMYPIARENAILCGHPEPHPSWNARVLLIHYIRVTKSRPKGLIVRNTVPNFSCRRKEDETGADSVECARESIRALPCAPGGVRAPRLDRGRQVLLSRSDPIR